MPLRRLLPSLLLLVSAQVTFAAWDSHARPVPEANLRAVHAVFAADRLGGRVARDVFAHHQRGSDLGPPDHRRGGAVAGRVYRSADRGETWEVSPTPLAAGPTAGVFGLGFWDAERGIAVGGDYRRDAERMDNVAVTSDGGRTWTKAGPAEPAGLKEASGQAWAVGERGLIVRWR